MSTPTEKPALSEACCNLYNTLRAYERVHATWMQTRKYNVEAYTRVKADLDVARGEYIAAEREYNRVRLAK